MIIKKYCYECKECKNLYFFEVGKYYSKICPICEIEMILEGTYDCDTEKAEQMQNTPSYDPTKDPNSQFYIPTVTCPYCQSTNTKKITTTSKAVHTAMFGVFAMGRNSKEWHCNSCKSDF